MKIAFIIDKTQTFQIVAKVLKTALVRNHICDVYCCFSKSQLDYLGDYYGEFKKNINWIMNTNRNTLVRQLENNRKNYNAVIGINFFNRALKPIFNNQATTNYGLEYCWNEVYNSAESRLSKFKSNGTLFCNNLKTQKMISQIIDFDNLEYLGSPWYEFLDECKVPIKSNKMIFMAPHQSFYNKVPNLLNWVNLFLELLNVYCKKREYKLVIKTRSKYSTRYDNIEGIDQVVTDENLCSHIQTYRDSKLVIHFSSSAVNELAYLQVPSLSIGPEIQKNLHTDMKCDEGIKLLHQYYYSGDIFDKKHCDTIGIEKYLNSEHLEEIFDRLINAEKNWASYQQKFFCQNFTGASDRIIKRLEKDEIKKNTTDQ